MRNEEPHNTGINQKRVQIRNEEPHSTGTSLKPTRVQIRNEEHHNTGISMKPTRVISNKKCSMEFSHSSDSNNMLVGNSSKGGGTKWKLPHGSGWDGISACPKCCSLQVEPTNMDLDMQGAHLD